MVMPSGAEFHLTTYAALVSERSLSLYRSVVPSVERDIFERLSQRGLSFADIVDRKIQENPGRFVSSKSTA